ncbi:MAG: hypothetical protein IJJ11_03465 [Methanosphaera sp.]|nr:hypothetical protein [Methanosphaera sp.]
MNMTLITDMINIISITSIMAVMIYYSFIFKKTSVQLSKIRSNRPKTVSK